MFRLRATAILAAFITDSPYESITPLALAKYRVQSGLRAKLG